MTIRVELEIHSGREPVFWTLDDEREVEMRRRLGRLRLGTPGEACRPPRLGYRGVTAEWPGARVALFGGCASLTDQRGTVTLLDRDRDLERWLLDTGRNIIDPGVLRHTPIA